MQIFATFGLLMLLQNMVLAATRGTAYTVGGPLAQHSVGVGPVQIGLSRLIALAAATLVAAGAGRCSCAGACWAGRSARWRRTGRAAIG